MGKESTEAIQPRGFDGPVKSVEKEGALCYCYPYMNVERLIPSDQTAR